MCGRFGIRKREQYLHQIVPRLQMVLVLADRLLEVAARLRELDLSKAKATVIGARMAVWKSRRQRRRVLLSRSAKLVAKTTKAPS